MVYIGLLGLGTVGTGVVEILEEKREDLKALIGKEIVIKKILVNDMNKKRSIELKQGILTDDFNEILEDEKIDILIEVTGDLEKSYEYIVKGIQSKKNIVTANKAVVSKYFEEFSSLAYENDVSFLYESSVGGGIPVIKPLREQIRLNEIIKIQGILNGTCNYILTRMIDEGKDYQEILEIAQELGYAESDPTDDVEGHDTLRKLRILGTLALQGEVCEEDILLQGINNINAIDIEFIKKMDSTVKLIGEVKLDGDGFTAIVQPTIVKNDDYFASVNLAYNSVAFEGNNVGELKFYGAGAGKLPTANAVLTDVLDIIMGSDTEMNPLGDKKLVNNNENIIDDYYLRVSKLDNQKNGKIEELGKKIEYKNNNLIVLIEETKLKNIMDLLNSLNIPEEEYFLARILK